MHQRLRLIKVFFFKIKVSKSILSTFNKRLTAGAQCVHTAKTMERCICESYAGRMLCLKGETLSQSSIIKTRDSPTVLKRKLCSILKAVQRWPFCVKASFTSQGLDFSGKLPENVCVHASMCE